MEPKKEKEQYLRSDINHFEKFTQCVEMLEVSLFLVHRLEIDSFINVIATQLRILICDSNRGKDNSLLLKVVDEPLLLSFGNITNPYKFLNGERRTVYDLFDDNSKPVALGEWVNQIIIQYDSKNYYSVKDLIKTFAEKDGGAHVDSNLNWTEIITTNVGVNYLILIALYILHCISADYDKDIKELILDPLNVQNKDRENVV